LFAEHHKSAFKGHPASNTIVPVCSFSFDPGKSFHLENHGADDLGFQFTVDGNPVGAVFTVQPGQKVNKNFPDFLPPEIRWYASTAKP